MAIGRYLRWLFWILVAGGVCAALVFALWPQPVLVDIVPVRRGPLQVSVIDDGITRIRDRYVVSTPLAGRLLRITYDVGDSVVARETVLARMQPTDPELLDPRAVAQARARVSAAERRQEAAKAELAKAEAALDFVEQELGRIRRLAPDRAISASELQQAEYLFRARSEEARAAAFQVEIAQYELQLERAALILTQPEQSRGSAPAEDAASPGDETNSDSNAGDSASSNEDGDGPSSSAQEDGKEFAAGDDQLPILSPITGRILRIYQESSAVIAAGAPLMELGDPSDLEVVVDALSQDAVRITPGDPVLLENWGREQPLRGRVRRVEPSGFTKVSALGVEEQRVNVIIDLVDGAEQRTALGDNFRVDANIIVWQQPEVLKIPTSALFRWGDRWHVFQVVDGTARQIPVTVGRNNGLEAQILDGLAAGEQVIVHPGDSVSAGTRVTARPPSSSESTAFEP